MTIAPVIQTVTVPVPPERAFALFTGNMDSWWKHPSLNADDPATDVVVEPKVGGRWFAKTQNGHVRLWGKVVAWDPPARFVLGWQLDASFDYDPDFLTEVEVTFRPKETGTEVRLEHRDLERFGESAERVRIQIGQGWPTQLASFTSFVEGNQQ